MNRHPRRHLATGLEDATRWTWTACGLVRDPRDGGRLTRDPELVTCQLCRRTFAYGQLATDRPSDMAGVRAGPPGPGPAACRTSADGA